MNLSESTAYMLYYGMLVVLFFSILMVVTGAALTLAALIVSSQTLLFGVVLTVAGICGFVLSGYWFTEPVS